jgi:predicted enzyme related to lactoylglutathione lyase
MRKPAIVHFEITGRDSSALRRFYGSLFGWEARETSIPGYRVLQTDDAGIAGSIGPSWDGVADGVTFYVEVADVGEALSDVEDLGGTIVRRPWEIAPLGLTFALFADPEGHVVGLVHHVGVEARDMTSIPAVLRASA